MAVELAVAIPAAVLVTTKQTLSTLHHTMTVITAYRSPIYLYPANTTTKLLFYGWPMTLPKQENCQCES
jgi:hypothetical protein